MKAAIVNFAFFTLLAVGLVAVNPVFALDETPEAFLQSIYSHYQGEPQKATGVFLDSDEAIHRYFEPSLAALIIKDDDEANQRGDVPLLDGDPFIDAQEWNISSLAIDVRHDGADKANAAVSFTNFDQNVKLDISLTHLRDGWKIADIASNRDDKSLRGLYAQAQTQTH